jgi:hypothetical protein
MFIVYTKYNMSSSNKINLNSTNIRNLFNSLIDVLMFTNKFSDKSYINYPEEIETVIEEFSIKLVNADTFIGVIISKLKEMASNKYGSKTTTMRYKSEHIIKGDKVTVKQLKDMKNEVLHFLKKLHSSDTAAVNVKSQLNHIIKDLKMLTRFIEFQKTKVDNILNKIPEGNRKPVMKNQVSRLQDIAFSSFIKNKSLKSVKETLPEYLYDNVTSKYRGGKNKTRKNNK